MLVAAFKATLEEVVEADIILHVRDIAHQDSEAQRADVERVLAELGIDAEQPGRVLEIWNKIDLLDAEKVLAVLNAARRQPAKTRPIIVSALTGQGIDELIAGLETRLAAERIILDLTLDAHDGRGRNWLYEHTEVLSRADARRRQPQSHRAGRAGAGRDGAGKVWRSRAGLAEELATPLNNAGSQWVLLFAGPMTGSAIKQSGSVGALTRIAWPRRNRVCAISKTKLFLERFGLVPKRVHLGKARRAAAAACDLSFDKAEAPRKFPICPAYRGFRIDADMAGEIGERKQKIADLILEGSPILAGERRFDLISLFPDLGKDELRIVPIEPDRGRLALKFHGAGQAGEGDGDIAEEPAAIIAGRPSRSALILAQSAFTSCAERPRSPPKTCGWRRINLSVIASTTSPKSKAPVSSAIRA